MQNLSGYTVNWPHTHTHHCRPDSGGRGEFGVLQFSLTELELNAHCQLLLLYPPALFFFHIGSQSKPWSISLRDLWVCSDDGGRLSELSGDWWETACLTGSLPFTPLDFLDRWHHAAISFFLFVFLFATIPNIDISPTLSSALLMRPWWYFPFTPSLMGSTTCFYVSVASPPIQDCVHLDKLYLSELCRQIWFLKFQYYTTQSFNSVKLIKMKCLSCFL